MKVFLIKYPFSISTRINKFYRDPEITTKLKEKRNEITKFYPKQHPKNLNSSITSLINPDRKPTKSLTPYREIPEFLYHSKECDDFVQPISPKTLYVGIFGATNVGKSTLLNKFLGEALSATSKKSHTTDEKITGVCTNFDKNIQLILYDTPGILAKYKGYDSCSNKAWGIMDEIDYALFVVDGAKKRVDDGLKSVLKKLNTKMNEMKFFRMSKNLDLDQDFKEEILQTAKPQKLSKILVVNKIDLCTNKRDLKWYINELEDLGNFDKIFYTSCETGYGLENLKSFLEEEAINDTWLFSPKAKTDMTGVERIEEVFKSLIFERMHYELPFFIGIELREFVIMSDSTAKIEVHFDVETQMQMKILIVFVKGYHGRNVRYIAQKARIELIKLYKKDFNVSIVVRKRNEKLKHLRAEDDAEEIVPKGFATREAKEDIERLKNERKERLIEATKALSNKINDVKVSQ